MAKQGQVWEKDGKFAINHNEKEPVDADYIYASKDEAKNEAARIFQSATSVEESCAGGSANKTAIHLNR
jgi:hypothetical protein